MTATSDDRRKWRRCLPAAGVALAMAVLPARAGAQPAPPRDPIAAEALFERGKTLMDQGHTVEACAAFAESQRLDPAGGTLLRLALCREAEGKLASAWLGYTEVVRTSREGTGEPAKLQERIRIAREHLAAIERRVPSLVIAVPPSTRVAGLAVSANGLPRNEGSWGVALPVDPGDVAIVATAPGRREVHVTVHVAEGQQQTVEVPALPPAAPTAAPPPGAAAPLPAETPRRGSIVRPLGVGVGVLGLAAIGVGTYFGVRAASKWGDSNAACPSSPCSSPAGVDLANDARSSARVADVTLAAGLAGVALGVVLFVAGAPSSVQARPAGVALAF
jgi:hypothetical protein